MSNGYVIEIDEVAAGLLVREGASYAFHAVDERYRVLEGMIFPSPHTAERTIRSLRRKATSERSVASARQSVVHDGWAGSMLSGAEWGETTRSGYGRA